MAGAGGVDQFETENFIDIGAGAVIGVIVGVVVGRGSNGIISWCRDGIISWCRDGSFGRFWNTIAILEIHFHFLTSLHTEFTSFVRVGTGLDLGQAEGWFLTAKGSVFIIYEQGVWRELLAVDGDIIDEELDALDDFFVAVAGVAGGDGFNVQFAGREVIEVDDRSQIRIDGGRDRGVDQAEVNDFVGAENGAGGRNQGKRQNKGRYDLEHVDKGGEGWLREGGRRLISF
jgi:hypothetical protein